MSKVPDLGIGSENLIPFSVHAYYSCHYDSCTAETISYSPERCYEHWLSLNLNEPIHCHFEMNSCTIGSTFWSVPPGIAIGTGTGISASLLFILPLL